MRIHLEIAAHSHDYSGHVVLGIKMSIKTCKSETSNHFRRQWNQLRYFRKNEGSPRAYAPILGVTKDGTRIESMVQTLKHDGIKAAMSHGGIVSVVSGMFLDLMAFACDLHQTCHPPGTSVSHTGTGYRLVAVLRLRWSCRDVLQPRARPGYRCIQR